MRDSFEILKEMGVPISQVRASGGGARSPVWLQIQADATGMEHVTINVDEGPAFGVALLAGVGVGIYPSVEKACRSTIKVVSDTVPDQQASNVYAGYYPVYRSLYQSLKGEFDKVAELSAK
jgi:xylulokinase